MPNYRDLRDFVGIRSIRLALAIAIIGLSVWAFSPHLAYRISSSAFVNSEIMRIAAPIPGYLASDLPQKGQFIRQPSSLVLVKSYATDRRKLLDLTSQKIIASRRAEFLSDQLREIAVLDRELERRVQAYKDGMTSRLALEIKEADAEQQGCLVEAGYRKNIGSRMHGLVKSGILSESRSDEALAVQQATSTRCQLAAARVEKLKAERKALERGVYLRDSVNDQPYSQQQRDQLLLRRQQLESEMHQERARASQLLTEIDEEQDRIARLGKFEATLPADHVVWSVRASPGSVVTEGQTVLDLADCDNRFVAVELPEREFESIRPGDPAGVRLIGSNRWTTGFVRLVRGSAANADERLLAARVPVPTNGNIMVEVSLPHDGTANESSSYCSIGRLADVRFKRGSTAIVDSLKSLFWAPSRQNPPSAKVAGR